MEEILTQIVNSYFDEPDKTLRELFEQYASDLSEEEREIFFKNLKEIIS